MPCNPATVVGSVNATEPAPLVASTNPLVPSAVGKLYCPLTVNVSAITALLAITLPASILPLPMSKLVPVAAPMLGVVSGALALILSVSALISSVLSSTLTLKVVPVRVRPSPALNTCVVAN